MPLFVAFMAGVYAIGGFAFASPWLVAAGVVLLVGVVLVTLGLCSAVALGDEVQRVAREQRERALNGVELFGYSEEEL